jgi:hypothetical protein
VEAIAAEQNYAIDVFEDSMMDGCHDITEILLKVALKHN